MNVHDGNGWSFPPFVVRAFCVPLWCRPFRGPSRRPYSHGVVVPVWDYDAI